MIRFECVSCAAVLRVTDDKAGKVAVCPKCKTKMQIPEPAGANGDGEEQEAPASQKRVQSLVSAAPRQHRLDAGPPVSQENTDEDEPSDEQSEENDDGDRDDEDRPRKRKRRRRRRRRSSSGSGSAFEMFVNPFTIGLAVGLGLWIIFVGLHLVGVPIAGLLAIGVGVLVAAVGRIWFLSIAFSDDSTVGYMVLWVPFYELYYVVSNFAETWKPYVLNFVGIGLALGALCLGGLSSMMDDEMPQGPPGNFNPNQPVIDGGEEDMDEEDVGPGMPGRPRGPGGPGGPPRFPKRKPADATNQLGAIPARSSANFWNASAMRFDSSVASRHASCHAASDCFGERGRVRTST